LERETRKHTSSADGVESTPTTPERDTVLPVALAGQQREEDTAGLNCINK